MEHDDSWMQEGSSQSQSQQSVEESSESSYQDSQSPIKPRANLPMSAPPPSLGTIAGAIAGAAPGYNTLSGGSHRTFSKELKMAGVMSMVDGVPPSCVSASLSRGAELVMGVPWRRPFPMKNFWQRARFALVRLTRLQFAATVANCVALALGHDGTTLNRTETLGVVAQALGEDDSDELTNVSSGPVVIDDQKSATEIETIVSVFALGQRSLDSVKELIRASTATDGEKRIALNLLGGDDGRCTLEKTVLILSDFANGARSTSLGLTHFCPYAETINCSEHAADNTSAAAIGAEKIFLLEDLCGLKPGGQLSKDDKQLAEVNAFLYSLSKLLHVTNTQIYYLNLGQAFETWHAKEHPNDVLHRMMRFKGCRFYVGLTNREVLRRMLARYSEFLREKIGGHNRIEAQIAEMLEKYSIQLAAVAGALWSDQFKRPIRYALCHKKSSYSDTKQAAAALVTFLEEIIADPSAIQVDERLIEKRLPRAIGHDTSALGHSVAMPDGTKICELVDLRTSLYADPLLGSEKLAKLLTAQAAAMLKTVMKHFAQYLGDGDDGSDGDSSDDGGSDCGSGDEENPTNDDDEGDGDQSNDEAGNDADGSVRSVEHPLLPGVVLKPGSLCLAMWISDKGDESGPFDAKVTDVNVDDSLSLLYEDGDEDPAVPLSALRAPVEISDETAERIAKVKSLATTSNHAVESLFAHQDFADKGAQGLDPSVLGALAGARFNKANLWLNAIKEKSPLLYQCFLQYCFTSMDEIHEETQRAVEDSKEAQLRRREAQVVEDRQQRRRKLAKEALFFARAQKHMCLTSPQVELIARRLTPSQWKWYYHYQLSIRALGYGWLDALEGKKESSQEQEMAFLVKRIDVTEKDRIPPTSPMFSSSAADPQEFALAQSAVAARQEAAEEEQGAHHALMSEANVRAEAERGSVAVLKKVCVAINPPVEATSASGKKRASSEVGGGVQKQKQKQKNGAIGHLELLRVGSRIQVCYMVVNPCDPRKKMRRWFDAILLSFSEDFVADNDPLLADAGSFKVEWINDEEGGDGEKEDEEDADDVVKAPQFRKDVRLVFSL